MKKVGPYYKTDVESSSGRVCECGPMGAPRAVANAAFIVRACNAHDDLLAALKGVVERIEQGGAVKREGVTGAAYSVWMSNFGEDWCDVFNASEAAIAKAEGREP